jgi:methionyl-tRNA formyltransferase
LNPAGVKNFAIAAVDRHLGVFQAFLSKGWRPIKLFTPCATDIQSAFTNKSTLTMAQQLGLPVQHTPIRAEDLEELQQAQCDLLVLASYAYRLPAWEAYLPYAINFHPSPLPIGRGPYPLIEAIQQGFRQWGVTCHKVSAEFDQGDVLAQKAFSMSPECGHDVLDLQAQIAAKELALKVAEELETLWCQAQVQREGCYFPLWDASESKLDFSSPLAVLLRQVLQFGAVGCQALLNQKSLTIRRASGWLEKHAVAPGTVVHTYHTSIVVACRDGFMSITDWTLSN